MEKIEEEWKEIRIFLVSSSWFSAGIILVHYATEVIMALYERVKKKIPKANNDTTTPIQNTHGEAQVWRKDV